MTASKMIGWECSMCTFTNKDCMHRDCQMCMSKRPEQYAIVVGASESASAHMMTFDRREKVRLATTSSNAPASGGASAAGDDADVF